MKVTMASSFTPQGPEYGAGRMLLFRAGDPVGLKAGTEGARLLLLGGAVMDGPRFIFWNFVSSSRERIEQAKADWKAGRFAKVAGDEQEFIPLPEIQAGAADRARVSETRLQLSRSARRVNHRSTGSAVSDGPSARLTAARSSAR
jgi:hypothetical protein